MSKEVYIVPYKYKNDLDLLNTVINVYSLTALKSSLTPKQQDTLRFYLQFGFTAKTKETIMKDLKITDKHLNQINCQLQKCGYLTRHPTNYRMKYINENLLKLKESFLSKKVDSLVIMFRKDETG